jgi:flagellar biosynthetic protein FliO
MNAAPEMLPAALKMISALAVVMGGLWMAVAFARRFIRRAGGANGEPMVRVLATHPLGVKKSITLVEVPGSLLVLGVTGERIQLLSRIRDPEILARLGRTGPAAAVSFYEHLSQLTARLRGGDHA